MIEAARLNDILRNHTLVTAQWRVIHHEGRGWITQPVNHTHPDTCPCRTFPGLTEAIHYAQTRGGRP